MIRNRFAPLVVAVLILAAGLALGAGKSSEDTSAANTISKVLLTIGFLAVVIAVVVLVVSGLRSRQRAT